MKAEFRASFAKDLHKIKDKEVLDRIKRSIEQIERSQSQRDITNLKKLKAEVITTESELAIIELG